VCVRRENAPLPIYILDIYIQYIYIFLIYIYLYIFLNPNSITKYRFLLDRQNEKTVQCQNHRNPAVMTHERNDRQKVRVGLGACPRSRLGAKMF
jgi:hypothetical protein